MTITLVNDLRWAGQDARANTQPAAPTPTTHDRCEWDIADYRTGLRWPVEHDAGSVVLRLGCGFGAVEFLARRGRAVSTVLRARNSLGPVLALPGQPLRWVFLRRMTPAQRSAARPWWAPGCG